MGSRRQGRTRDAKGLRDRISPTCTLSQNGYGEHCHHSTTLLLLLVEAVGVLAIIVVLLVAALGVLAVVVVLCCWQQSWYFYWEQLWNLVYKKDNNIIQYDILYYIIPKGMV